MMHVQAYKEQVKRLQRNDAPIGGVGIQAHFSDISDINLLIVSLPILM